MREVFIYDALRTPRGKAREGGGLAEIKPQEIIRQIISGLEGRCGDTDVDGFVLGCVGQFGTQGGNIALVSKLHSGLPDAAPAMTVNNYCVSGLSAIGLAASKIAAEEWSNAYAGGIEMMSQAPFLGDRASYYTDASFPKRSRFVPVAVAADRLANAQGIERAALDEAALRSQEKAAKAEANAALNKSRISVMAANGAVALDSDDCIRPHTTAEGLADMPPAFAALAEEYADALGDDRFPALHTIAHAPPICDGAGLALVGTEKNDATPRARIIAFAEAGGDPCLSLTAGYTAMEMVLARAGLTLDDMGAIEFMEAFGVTIAKFLRDYPVDSARVNISGGHLAKGHPLGASGAILASTLLDCLEDAGGRYGLVVATAASGAGAAMIVERV